MRVAALVLAALLAAPAAAGADRPIRAAFLPPGEPLPQTTAEAAHAATGKRLGAVADHYRFSGEYLVARGDDSWGADTIVRDRPVRPDHRSADLRALTAPRLWRWASVTKQLVATLVMQEVAAGHIALDRPVGAYLPRFASPNARLITVRQLLRHQSGLPNPDDTAATPDAVPAYDAPGYKGSRDPLTGYCAGPVKGPPGGRWEYNNCDYIVAGALLQAVTGKPWAVLVRERIARPLGLRSLGAFPTAAATEPGFVDGQPEPAVDFTAYQASAGLYGTARDLLGFDRALMRGRLLPEAARAQMWDGQPQLGSIALGQWVFAAPLKGCAAPVTIVERRGQIGGVEVRNVMVPEKDVVVIAFVNRAGFDFGEIWQGKGFTYDLLAAAVCA